MERIEWTNDVQVGIAVIDEEHRQMVGLINQLYEAIGDRWPINRLGQVVDELTVCANRHFATEERLMRTHDAPVEMFAAHVRDHRAFTTQLRDLRRDLDAGVPAARMNLWQLGEKWWVKHVLVADMELARLISE